jgi:5-methyltetrahydropteroyltriglutamate--homocysteine methyltransferase
VNPQWQFRQIAVERGPGPPTAEKFCCNAQQWLEQRASTPRHPWYERFEMSQPQFRADHIGSLLRPASLLEIRRVHEAGKASAEETKAAEDAAIKEAVAMQERAGLDIISDGEFRRASYHSYFFSRLGNLKPDWRPPEDIPGAHGTRAPQPVALIGSKVEWTAPIHAADYKFIKSLTNKTPKVTIPGPCALHFRGGDAAILKSAYSDTATFWDDIITAFRKELQSLADAGCTYVQMDETAFAKFEDPEVQQRLEERGENWRETIMLYIKITNRVLGDLPNGMRVGVHLCRGNRAGQFHAAGSYEPVADLMFNTLNSDLFLLEYDSERAGGFEPLRFLPKNKSVVLGLVSTKTGALEDKDFIKKRINDASTFVDLDRLALSPQCGFASVDIGNPLTQAEQEAKLRLVCDVARDVWG